MNALQATFVHTPAGESVDWRLSATISPCHVTVICHIVFLCYVIYIDMFVIFHILVFLLY